MHEPMTDFQRGVIARALQSRELALEKRGVERQGGIPAAEHARRESQQDPHDLQQRDGEFEIEAALALQEADELASVRNALGRVHDAGFGRCRRCDTDIPIDRLAAEPQALYCVACARASEAERAG